MTVVAVPFPLQISGGQGDLVVRGADNGAERDPVRVLTKEIGTAALRVSATRQLRNRAQVLLAAPARVGELKARFVADGREVARIEEGT